MPASIAIHEALLKIEEGGRWRLVEATAARCARSLGSWMIVVALSAFVVGCGASKPEPTGSALALEEYEMAALGLWHDDSPDGRALRAEKWRSFQSQIATCMRDAGFEYFEEPPSGGFSPEESAFPDDTDTLAFAKLYGYGITAGPDGPKKRAGDGPSENQLYLDSLGEKARVEYQRAMEGDNFGKSPEDFNYDNPTGCYMSSWMAEFGAYTAEPNSEWDQLFMEIEKMRQNVDLDERIVNAEERWSDCMADAGVRDVARVSDAMGMVSASFYRGEGDFASDAEIEYEIDIAVSDFECRDRVGYSTIKEEVKEEYEAEFVKRYQPDLEGWVMAMAERRGEPTSASAES